MSDEACTTWYGSSMAAHINCDGHCLAWQQISKSGVLCVGGPRGGLGLSKLFQGKIKARTASPAESQF